jgi:hypothetical protein
MIQPDVNSNQCKADKYRVNLFINSGVICKEDITLGKLLFN